MIRVSRMSCSQVRYADWAWLNTVPVGDTRVLGQPVRVVLVVLLLMDKESVTIQVDRGPIEYSGSSAPLVTGPETTTRSHRNTAPVALTRLGPRGPTKERGVLAATKRDAQKFRRSKQRSQREHRLAAKRWVRGDNSRVLCYRRAEDQRVQNLGDMGVCSAGNKIRSCSGGVRFGPWQRNWLLKFHRRITSIENTDCTDLSRTRDPQASRRKGLRRRRRPGSLAT